MSMPYGPPVQVSPLIRGLRWGLLFAGIIYGRMKLKVYSAMEASYREEEAKRKVIRDKELAILKAKIAAEERENVRLLESGKLFDTDIPPPPPLPKSTPKGPSGGGGIGTLPDGSRCREAPGYGTLPDGTPCRKE